MKCEKCGVPLSGGRDTYGDYGNMFCFGCSLDYDAALRDWNGYALAGFAEAAARLERGDELGDFDNGATK